jgi:DNA phosphorothioation-dependent restriction protein DptH
MSPGLHALPGESLQRALEELLGPVLAELLRERQDGHCMRVSDLPQPVMEQLCLTLRADVPKANVFILDDGSHAGNQLYVSSTKLVELRNPFADGRQRPPLLVFIPAAVRTSAEDSFGVATFEEINLGGSFGRLKESLLSQLPKAIRGVLTESLRRLQDRDNPWPFATDTAVCRFLLTGRENGGDGESYGGALYELALLPDFELFADPSKVPQRLIRNRNCVDMLTWSSKSERGRILDLGLANRGFRNELGNVFVDRGLEQPQEWTKAIVLDRQLWKFAFNRWEFADKDADPDCISVFNVTTNLPTLEDDQADEKTEQLVGQQILPLGTSGIKKFAATFETEPHPAMVQGLDRFLAQVISKESGPVGLVRAKKVWQGKKQGATVNFDKLGKVDWEEGWHFIRIIPQTEAGDLLAILGADGNPIPWSTGERDEQLSNESDLFYVLPDDGVEVDPPQRAVPNDASLEHARIRLHLKALGDQREPDAVTIKSCGWMDGPAKGNSRGNEHLEIRFTREGAVRVPVSKALKSIEQRILASPRGPLNWRQSIRMGEVSTITSGHDGWPVNASCLQFLDAREAYFAAVRQEEHELITQGADFRQLTPHVEAYADAYRQLLADLSQRTQNSNPAVAQQALTELRSVMAIDTIAIEVADHRDERREATLVAPTHPLRALWLANWTNLAAHWIHQQAGEKEPSWLDACREALLSQLSPVAFPPVIPTETGSLLTAIENLSPFWTVYAPASEEDPRSLLGELCAGYHLADPSANGSVIDGAYLAQRFRRYLLQHPYVKTLTINAFNPGRGGLLAEALLILQKDKLFSDLRYDIRVFVLDPDSPVVADELSDLREASGKATSQEGDAFLTPSQNHLTPKLQHAVLSRQAFHESPQDFPAHISLLFDLFPAEDVGVVQVDTHSEHSAMHGLIQSFRVSYCEDSNGVAWRRRPVHGKALPFSDKDNDNSSLLAQLSNLVSSATATVASGQTSLDLRPEIALALDAEDRALLHRIHDVSDWVMTLDRNMGIEYFDHAGNSQRPNYIIDHTPDNIGLGGHQLIITSRSLTELEALLRPVLQSYGLEAEGGHALAILDQLRSLSGRLALKLISAATQRAEALGLALSRMFLEHQGAFENQIVVPLDSHLELYQELKAKAEDAGEALSFKRTDLALFDLNAAERTITCRLVEVKCYAGVGDVSAYAKLKESIAEQIEQSQVVLAHHFDPSQTTPDRPDRFLKSRQLSLLLDFYLERSERYGIIAPDCAAEARSFLCGLEDGYRLSFTRSALIFDFEKSGTNEPDIENGIEYHRVGSDLIHQLIAAAAPESNTSTSFDLRDKAGTTTDPTTSPSMTRILRRRERAPSVPHIASAAFKAPPREHSQAALVDRGAEAVSLVEYPQAEERDDSIPSAAESLPNEESYSTEVFENKSNPNEMGQKPQPPEIEQVAPIEAGDSREETTAPEPPSEQAAVSKASYDVMLGVTGASPQNGILGQCAGRTIALDLNHTHTISLFGVQGGGKSYTLGSIAEMASLPIPSINTLPQPLSTVIFHYSPTMDYAPEFTSMVHANDDEGQLNALKETYGAEPKALTDVLLLAPEDKVDERRLEYPGIEVRPLKFAASELQASHWRFLMGAVGNQATYVKQLNRVMKGLRNDLTIDGLRKGIEGSRMPDNLKELANGRIDLAAEYIDDDVRVKELIHPGRLVIVDLRDEFIEKDEALGLFVVMLQLFADATYEGKKFNKLVVFDEAHKYIESPDLVSGLIEVVREMRHKGTSIMVASQDPPSVPVPLIELSSQIILHKFNSPAWLKHIQKANTNLQGLSPQKMSHLRPGEAYIWSSKATDEAFTKDAVKIKLRPRVTKHGGDTKTAVN